MINKILKSIFVATLLMMGAISAEAAVKSIGSVSAISGDAYAVNDDGSRVDLALKSPIFQNQTVVTGQDGKVQIIFADSSIFTISANTELLIDEYVYDPETEQGKSIMNATKGVFKFVTGKIAKNNREEVKVKTPFATIGVRGSGGIVAVDPTQGTRVGLTQCCLDVQTPNSPAPMPLNQMGTFIEVQDPDQPVPQPKPVDAEFSRVIQENFGGDFGEDDGTEDPVQPNNQASNEDSNADERKQKEERVTQKRGEDRGERRQEDKQARNLQQQPRPVDGEKAPLEPVAENEPQPILEPVDGEPALAPLTAETTEPEPFVQSEPVLIDPVIAVDGVQADLVGVNQEKIDEEASGIGGATLGNPTHFGKFVRKDTGGAIIEGSISGQFLTDGKFVARIVDSDRTIDTVLPINNTGFNTLHNVIIDGTQFNIRYFKHPSDEFFVLNLEDVQGSDNIAVFAGEPYDGVLPTAGVATYGFVPNFSNTGDVNQQTKFEGALYNDYLSQNFIGGNLKTRVNAQGNVVIDGFTTVFGTIGSDDQNGTIAQYDFGSSNFEDGTVGSAEYFGSGALPAGVVMDSTVGTNTSIDAFAKRPDDTHVEKAIAEQGAGIVTHQGFSGGFMNVDGASLEKAYSVVESGLVAEGVSIDVDSANNHVLAKMDARVDGNDMTMFNYGINEQTLHSSAYAAEALGKEGVVVSDIIADEQFRCVDCDYVHWGIWTGDIGDKLGSVGNEYADGIKYVAGQMTSASELSAVHASGAGPTSVDYHGKTIGAISNGAGQNHYVGNFGANVNFATRDVDITQFTLGNYALSSDSGISWNNGDQAFTGSLAIDNGVNTLSGTINGAFFGTGAEDIGGNYGLSDGGSIEASGVYLGTSQ